MPEDVFTDAGESFATSKMVRDWLRKPFKPEQIGKLPATAKRPALDFVGHAAVTDRLNKIAPDWSYTVDTMSELNGKVWIRGTMTIGGVSRPEFGDGADPKEAIGNFIRRGAMRFGVAIDLWSREELDSTPAQHGVDGGGLDNASSSPDRSEGTTTAEQGHRGTAADPSGSSVGEGEASAVTGPGEGQTGSHGTRPHSSLGPDQPGPPHYPLEPSACDHRRTTGTKSLLSPRKSPRGPVCPRCGLSYIAVTEGTTADLGAA